MLLVWITIFLIVSASIPLGLAVGFGTVALTNLLEITDLSLYPAPNPAAKVVASVWIVLFFVYFAIQASRVSEKKDNETKIARGFLFKPLLFVFAYFVLLLVVGLFAAL